MDEGYSFWEFVKNYPYWERFKRDTWYYFRPFAHGRDLKRYLKSNNIDDADYSYNNRKKNETKEQNMGVEKEKRD